MNGNVSPIVVDMPANFHLTQPDREDAPVGYRVKERVATSPTTARGLVGLA